MATTGEKIKQLLAEQGKTQVDLAKALHVTDKTVSAWVNDSTKTGIRKSNLVKIADYFGVPYSSLKPDESEADYVLEKIRREDESGKFIFDQRFTQEIQSHEKSRKEFCDDLEEGRKWLNDGFNAMIDNVLDEIKMLSDDVARLRVENILLKRQKSQLMETVKRTQEKLNAILEERDQVQ